MFVQLLQAVFRVYHCNWLVPVQKGSVENCIKVLSDVGKIKILLAYVDASLTNPFFLRCRSVHHTPLQPFVCLYLGSCEFHTFTRKSFEQKLTGADLSRHTNCVPICLYPPAKGRAIAIPVDLDNQVNNLFVKSNNIVQKTAMSWRLSARNAARRDSVVTASRDYRNIIERLQVLFL